MMEVSDGQLTRTDFEGGGENCRRLRLDGTSCRVVLWRAWAPFSATAFWSWTFTSTFTSITRGWMLSGVCNELESSWFWESLLSGFAWSVFALITFPFALWSVMMSFELLWVSSCSSASDWSIWGYGGLWVSLYCVYEEGKYDNRL